MRIARNYWIVGAALGGLLAFVPGAMAQRLSGGTQLVQYNQEEHGAAAKEEGEEEGAAVKARGEREGAEAKEQGEREGDDAKYRGNGHNSAPELDPTALGNGILMLAGGVLLLSERRRQKR